MSTTQEKLVSLIGSKLTNGGLYHQRDEDNWDKGDVYCVVVDTDKVYVGHMSVPENYIMDDIIDDEYYHYNSDEFNNPVDDNTVDLSDPDCFEKVHQMWETFLNRGIMILEMNTLKQRIKKDQEKIKEIQDLLKK